MIPEGPNGHIYCYNPKTWEVVYDGNFYGAVALDNRGKGAIIFRTDDESIATRINGANCLIHYSDVNKYGD